MGLLLRFSARSPRSVSVNAEGGPNEARVLLFTGVRYEREPVNTIAKPARRQKRTRKGQAER